MMRTAVSTVRAEPKIVVFDENSVSTSLIEAENFGDVVKQTAESFVVLRSSRSLTEISVMRSRFGME